MKPQVPSDLREPIKDYCRRNFIAPTDLFRTCLGQEVRQPFLIEPDAVHGRSQKERYLKTLAFLCGRSPEKFEAAVKDYKGHVRRLFAKSREEIETTGSSNVAEPIPRTGWWAAVGMSGYSKMDRIYEVMRRMGFSRDYCLAVGWFPADGSFRVEI